LVADQAVAGLEVLHGGGVVGPDVLDQRQAVGPGEGEPAHVADVEHAGPGADGGVLVDDGAVLDRHLPAGEIDEAPAVGGVPLVQGRAEQRHGSRRRGPAPGFPYCSWIWYRPRPPPAKTGAAPGGARSGNSGGSDGSSWRVGRCGTTS